MYLSAVEEAVSQPGLWIRIPRVFRTEANASVTANCLAHGFLRVRPRAGDASVTMNGKQYLATAAPVRTRVQEAGGVWHLSIVHEAVA